MSSRMFVVYGGTGEPIGICSAHGARPTAKTIRQYGGVRAVPFDRVATDDLAAAWASMLRGWGRSRLAWYSNRHRYFAQRRAANGTDQDPEDVTIDGDTW